MNMATLADWQRADVERRLIKKHGEIVTIQVTELEDYPNPDDPDGANLLRPVEKEYKFYIGRMGAGQLGNIVAVLGAILLNGNNFKTLFERSDNLAYAQVIDDGMLHLLFKTILGMDQEWVAENFDPAWLVDVVLPFAEYNNFFGSDGLVGKLMTRLGASGFDETRIQGILGGSTP